MELLSAQPSDAAELTAVVFAAKRHWGYPEEWIRLWADELTVDAEYIATNTVVSVLRAGRIIGWCAVVRDTEVWWLDYCWVLPQAMDLGVGRQLVQHVLSLAIKSGVWAVKVIADPHATGFYEKLGFARVGTHPSRPRGRVLPVALAPLRGGVRDYMSR